MIQYCRPCRDLCFSFINEVFFCFSLISDVDLVLPYRYIKLVCLAKKKTIRLIYIARACHFHRRYFLIDCSALNRRFHLMHGTTIKRFSSSSSAL